MKSRLTTVWEYKGGCVGLELTKHQTHSFLKLFETTDWLFSLTAMHGLIGLNQLNMSDCGEPLYGIGPSTISSP